MDPTIILLAMQAAGMVVDYFGKSQQTAMAGRGAKLQEQAIQDAIKTSRLQYEEESLSAMRKLRQNLGTQAAVMAARGVRSGAGNAVISQFESVGNFNADERIRKINQMNREAALRANIKFSEMHQEAYSNQKSNEFFKSAFEKIPTNKEFYQGLGKQFGFGLSPVRARPIG